MGGIVIGLYVHFTVAISRFLHFPPNGENRHYVIPVISTHALIISTGPTWLMQHGASLLQTTECFWFANLISILCQFYFLAKHLPTLIGIIKDSRWVVNSEGCLQSAGLRDETLSNEARTLFQSTLSHCWDETTGRPVVTGRHYRKYSHYNCCGKVRVDGFGPSPSSGMV